MQVTRTDYAIIAGQAVVSAYCRDLEGNRSVVQAKDFRPYFYVPEDELDRIADQPHDSELYETIHGDKVWKIYVTLPEDVPVLREKFSRTYEADVLFSSRYLIDQIEKVEYTVPKILYLDIETDNRGRVPTPTNPTDCIICLSVYDNLSSAYTSFIWREDLSAGKNYGMFGDNLHEVNFYRDEVTMLRDFAAFVKATDADVVVGWNVQAFDLTYIINRMLKLGLDANQLSSAGRAYVKKDAEVIIKGCAVLDLYSAYRRMVPNQEESYKLDYIAKKVLGVGKVFEQADVKWLWKNDLDKLMEYNLQDVKLCVGINEKLRLIDFLDELRRLCFCQLEDTLATSKVIDSYILRTMHNRKVMPTKTHHEDSNTSVEGAIVIEPMGGINEYVAVFDVRSMYPSIILAAGLSPECISEELTPSCLNIDGIFIDQAKIGFLPEIVKNLFEQRNYYKALLKKEVHNSNNYALYDSRQQAYKVIMNALYGQTNYPNSRLYAPKIAKTITFLGRSALTHTKQFLEQLGFVVVYGDTDSLMWITKELNLSEISVILSKVNQELDVFCTKLGLRTGYLVMEFDKLYSKIFFVPKVKKRYVGNIVWEK